MSIRGFTVLAAAAALVLVGTAYADPPGKYGEGHGKDKHHKQEAHRGGPPPWAPAHGYRAREERGDRDDAAVYERHTRAFGILSGTCDRQALGAVLGGAVGAVVGSRVGSDQNRTVATVAGVIVGAVIGHEIGKRMDRADEACTGQVLERAGDHETVRWRNPQSGVEFLVTPLRTFEQGDRYCRTFETVAVSGSDRRARQENACRNPDGSWGSR